jgi:hypothetical protein
MADRLAIAVELHKDGIMVFAAGQALLAILLPMWGTFQRRRLWHGGGITGSTATQASKARWFDVRRSLLADTQR